MILYSCKARKAKEKGNNMTVYKIEYVETVRGYFGVEANSEEEALGRFNEWQINGDYVYDVMGSTNNIDCDYFINDDICLCEEDILTDEMYQSL